MGKRLQPQGPRRVHVNDVAALAGCSIATVSRVLNERSKVDPELVKRVRKAAKELGYTPNNAARTLRMQRTHILGSVIPTLNHAIFARQVNAIQQRLADAHYSLIVTTAEYDLQRECLETKMLVERGAEGVVLIGDSHAPELYEFLEAAHVPHVNTYVYRGDSNHPSIGFDNRRSAVQVVKFLMMLGHRNFALVAGISRDNDRVAEREAAVRETLHEAGIPLAANREFNCPYTIEAGRIAIRALMQGADRPTAVVCTSDILAFGVLTECYALGVRVPQEVSVTGFDDLEFAAHLIPSLTTVEVPAAEMGKRAADYLLDRLRGISVNDHSELETRLIVRESTGAPQSQRPL